MNRTGILFGIIFMGASFILFGYTIESVNQERIEAQRKIDSLQIELRHCQEKETVGMRLFKREKKWLSRAIYSETKREDEMWFVGNVIRNRVETGYRGRYSYKGVILDDKQFSAFNHRVPTRYNKTAENVATSVLLADRDSLTFPAHVTHFYSPRSMSSTPDWAYEYDYTAAKVNPNRFRFYSSRTQTTHSNYTQYTD